MLILEVLACCSPCLALRIEKAALERMKGTEFALRDAAENITNADTKVEKATEPLRKLHQDLMGAELAVNATWSMFDTFRSGVRTVARSAIAIAANATTAAGRIDNFIAAFATIGFSDQNTCIMNTSDPYLKRGKGRSDPHVAATLQNELTGCTYENYTLSRPHNITITAVDDVVTLGEDGMLILGAGNSFKMYSTALKTCPFLLEEFLLEGGKTMAWGGFWTMKNPRGFTEVRFNREKRHMLVGLARAFGELELQLPNSTSRSRGRGRRATKTIPKLADAVHASLVVPIRGGKTLSLAEDLVNRIAIGTEAVERPTNTTTVKTTKHRRPVRQRRRRRTSAATTLGNVAFIVSLSSVPAFSNALIS
ncbi:hypothetical protein ERJ75_000413200 [Trypanosoma vivax]|uniref:Trypanosome variant surface glycoprotein A-type N-terminal domain-containing protein n=1 Tax=Trypanosoma vivax (strain Y486) TaxID=1055687 RepID=F9WP96_TRYVY|nr:hypothetical protein ERJ75_000413200 [Trypanosoma vivax]CCD19371.1 hypothetical protein, conserved in T. vivax [Trypanosoma vivax Y486]|eukprot:CCD19371.1 hypothetical protein, conserved in T. vivax [Trypanosoma vivax Y486]